MKISIIIPVYNHEDYLEEAIESAYNQTLSPHEIIVVNDGSTDKSGEIANRYTFPDFPLLESPVKVIHQTNKGLPSARNTGIMSATGDYILFLDSDDVLLDKALSVFNNQIILSGGKADLIAPSFIEFGKSNREVILGNFTIDDLKQANRLPYFCLFKKSLLLELGGYNPKMKWGWEDYDLIFDIWKRGNKNIIILQEILIKYRVRENSMIKESNEHAEELYKQIMKNHPSLFK